MGTQVIAGAPGRVTLPSPTTLSSQSLTVNIRLELGAVGQTIQVSGYAVQVAERDKQDESYRFRVSSPVLSVRLLLEQRFSSKLVSIPYFQLAERQR